MRRQRSRWTRWSGNVADAGGGLFNFGTLTLTDCTISGNSTYPSGAGGLNNYHGTLSLTDCTVSGNSPGGIYSTYFPTSTLSNTIVAGNGGADILGSFAGTFNLIGGNPMLAPLGNYGGPTQTMAILPGSPALNAGDPNQLGTLDQRGVARSGGVNIGAFQASATAFVVSAPGMVQPGVPFDITVTAVDPFGQLAVGYLGTVTFSSSDPDPGVVLPMDYTFQPSDAGSVTLSAMVTLITPGPQMITATDTADNTITGSANVMVGGTAPGPVSHRRDQPVLQAIADETFLAFFPFS